ncbi:vomeronasal type-2 receptor 26-like [Pelobates cultripes]|uniref:Vomeronasal type-2 receptor 26-like n=1 Tax=Pelobates cultripes TaxID=61616 RepID=A0AAD1W9I1_PELCU|nr:vomeronasal type-2 receptor 26-like [Pelobates cultripes]
MQPIPKCKLTIKESEFFMGSLQEGDIIIGGIFTVNSNPVFRELFIKSGHKLNQQTFELHATMSLCLIGNFDCPYLQYYIHFLTFIFAIDEINSNPDILPNVTLGYHVLDSCVDVNKAIENIIKILSGFNSNIPNYSCRKYGQLAGIIGDLSSQTSLHIANILSIYRYPQVTTISYGATDPHLTNKHFYPSLFRTLPNDQIQAEAIVKLLKHFGWTWIGIITIDDENGEIQSRELKQIAVLNGICIEFSLNITPYVNFDQSRIKKNIKTLKSSTSNIIVVCGSVSAFSVFNMEKESEAMYGKTFVIPASWHIQFEIENQAAIILLNGSLVFRHPSKSIPSLQKYLEGVSVSSRPHDTLLEMIMAMKQQCLSSDDNMNKVMQLFLRDSLHNCSKDDLLTDLFTQQEYYTQRFQATYKVYKAVYAMVQSLHEMQSFLSSMNLEKYRHKLEHFLRKVHFKDPIGESTTFNENGEIMTVYEIKNYILIDDSIVTVVVGTFNPSAPDEGQLIILESDIMWKYSANKGDHPSSLLADRYRMSCNSSLRQCVPQARKGVSHGKGDRTSTSPCEQCRYLRVRSAVEHTVVRTLSSPAIRIQMTRLQTASSSIRVWDKGFFTNFTLN